MTNFTGLSSATSQYSGKDIFFALDIFNTARTKTATNDCTGVVGATLTQRSDINPPAHPPLPGSVWLMGSILGGGVGFRAWRRRRKASAVS